MPVEFKSPTVHEYVRIRLERHLIDQLVSLSTSQLDQLVEQFINGPMEEAFEDCAVCFRGLSR